VGEVSIWRTYVQARSDVAATTIVVCENQLRDSAIQRDNQQKYAIELDRRRLLLCEGSLALDDPVQELKIFVLL